METLSVALAALCLADPPAGLGVTWLELPEPIANPLTVPALGRIEGLGPLAATEALADRAAALSPPHRITRIPILEGFVAAAAYRPLKMRVDRLRRMIDLDVPLALMTAERAVLVGAAVDLFETVVRAACAHSLSIGDLHLREDLVAIAFGRPPGPIDEPALDRAVQDYLDGGSATDAADAAIRAVPRSTLFEGAIVSRLRHDGRGSLLQVLAQRIGDDHPASGDVFRRFAMLVLATDPQGARKWAVRGARSLVDDIFVGSLDLRLDADAERLEGLIGIGGTIGHQAGIALALYHLDRGDDSSAAAAFAEAAELPDPGPGWRFVGPAMQGELDGLHTGLSVGGLMSPGPLCELLRIARRRSHGGLARFVAGRIVDPDAVTEQHVELYQDVTRYLRQTGDAALLGPIRERAAENWPAEIVARMR